MTIGYAQPPRKQSEQYPFKYRTDAYWNGYRWQAFLDIQVNAYVLAEMTKVNGVLSDDKFAALLEAYERAERWEEIERLVSGHDDALLGLSYAINSHKTPSLLTTEGGSSSLEPLEDKGLLNDNEKPKRARRGSRGMTSFGRKMVKSGGVLLEEQFTKNCLMLGTATLPTMEPEMMKQACECWAEITRQFFQALTRLLESRGLSTEYVQVTEIQEKRFSRWGQIAPHLHWVCQSRKNRYSDYAIAPSEVRDIWQRILSNVLGAELDVSAATRIEQPRGSLKRELGKYLSKGSKVARAVVEAGRGDELPTAWWGAAKALKLKVKARIVVLNGESATFLLRNLDKLQACGELQYRSIEIELTDQETGKVRQLTIGYSGWFTSDSAQARFLDCVGYGQEEAVFMPVAA